MSGHHNEPCSLGARDGRRRDCSHNDCTCRVKNAFVMLGKIFSFSSRMGMRTSHNSTVPNQNGHSRVLSNSFAHLSSAVLSFAKVRISS